MFNSTYDYSCLAKSRKSFFPSSTTLNAVCREYVVFKTAIAFFAMLAAQTPLMYYPEFQQSNVLKDFKEKAKNQLLKQRFYDISLFPACQLF